MLSRKSSIICLSGSRKIDGKSLIRKARHVLHSPQPFTVVKGTANQPGRCQKPVLLRVVNDRAFLTMIEIKGKD